MTEKEEFLAKMKGVKAQIIAKVMNRKCPGVNFMGSSKGLMADAWQRRHDDRNYHSLRGVSLEQLHKEVQQELGQIIPAEQVTGEDRITGLVPADLRPGVYRLVCDMPNPNLDRRMRGDWRVDKEHAILRKGTLFQVASTELLDGTAHEIRLQNWRWGHQYLLAPPITEPRKTKFPNKKHILMWNLVQRLERVEGAEAIPKPQVTRSMANEAIYIATEALCSNDAKGFKPALEKVVRCLDEPLYELLTTNPAEALKAAAARVKETT